MKTIVTKSLSIICITVLSITVFNGCKKYPEGPSFTLLTKKQRICNTWVVDKFIVNGIDQTSLFLTVLSGYQIEIKKDGTYTATTNSGALEDGKWEFTNNKEDLKITVNATNEVNVNEILKLEDKAFWFKTKEGSNTINEFHFKEK